MPDSDQENKKTQNLSIFLIKEDLLSSEDIIKSDPPIKKHQVEYNGYKLGQLFVQKRVSIRGIGENELVWVLQEEFARLPERTKELFRNP